MGVVDAEGTGDEVPGPADVVELGGRLGGRLRERVAPDPHPVEVVDGGPSPPGHDLGVGLGRRAATTAGRHGEAGRDRVAEGDVVWPVAVAGRGGASRRSARGEGGQPRRHLAQAVHEGVEPVEHVFGREGVARRGGALGDEPRVRDGGRVAQERSRVDIGAADPDR